MKGVFDTLGPDGYGTYLLDLSGPAPTYERVSRPSRGILVPGFIDIHTHGANGIDYMASKREEILRLLAGLRTLGYEGLCPTTVTASPEAVSSFLAELPSHEMVLGFHLEGPFISKEYPGAQPFDAIEMPPLGPSPWDPILDDPRLRVITLAPELPHALELTTRLMTRGVKVSMGHTAATYEEARRGFEFGAAHTTHTFNAMRPFHHREAGTVGYALANDALYTELIYDRHHVCPEAARLLLKCKPHDRVLAVSDSTMAAGMPPGTEFTMWGLRCVTGRGDVRLVETGGLAGSAITLFDAFVNLSEDFGPEVAIRACCINPRVALGLSNPPKVWVEFDQNLRFTHVHELPQAS